MPLRACVASPRLAPPRRHRARSTPSCLLRGVRPAPPGDEDGEVLEAALVRGARGQGPVAGVGEGAGDRAPPLGPDGGALVLLDGLHEVDDLVEAPLGLGGVRPPPVPGFIFQFPLIKSSAPAAPPAPRTTPQAAPSAHPRPCTPPHGAGERQGRPPNPTRSTAPTPEPPPPPSPAHTLNPETEPKGGHGHGPHLNQNHVNEKKKTSHRINPVSKPCVCAKKAAPKTPTVQLYGVRRFSRPFHCVTILFHCFANSRGVTQHSEINMGHFV